MAPQLLYECNLALELYICIFGDKPRVNYLQQAHNCLLGNLCVCVCVDCKHCVNIISQSFIKGSVSILLSYLCFPTFHVIFLCFWKSRGCQFCKSVNRVQQCPPTFSVALVPQVSFP